MDLNKMADKNMQDFIFFGHILKNPVILKCSSDYKQTLQKVNQYKEILDRHVGEHADDSVSLYGGREEELQKYHFKNLQGRIQLSVNYLEKLIAESK